MRTFVLGVLLGRGLRYGIEGILAVLYGDAALDFLLTHSKRVRALDCRDPYGAVYRDALDVSRRARQRVENSVEQSR